jgi:hypothetical protein
MAKKNSLETETNLTTMTGMIYSDMLGIYTFFNFGAC